MSPSSARASGAWPPALIALSVGAFGIGTTEFVIMGLLQQVAGDLGVDIPAAGLLITGYALGVFVGAPLLTALTARMPRKALLVALMAIFTVGNLACALAPDYAWLMVARVVTSLAHGTFFGVGAVVATGLVAPERRAWAIAIMFTGLTLASLLGVPAGTWLGQVAGWRATFWAVTGIGVIAMAVIAWRVPRAAAKTDAVSLGAMFSVLARPQVLLGLAMTVLGFAGVFVVFTYIEPLLMREAGFSEAAVSPLLLVLGAGLIAGNLLGGWLADARPTAALLGTLAALAAVLAATSLAVDSHAAMVVALALFGVAAFATVAPLQMRVLQAAEGAGQSLASSLNIAAFNLGNAFGAWLGGAAIDRGLGFGALPWLAALVTLAGLAVALGGVALQRAGTSRAPALCAQGAD